MKFEELSINQKYVEDFAINSELVMAYAKLVGDMNPLHIDKDFSKNGIFGKPIVHGILLASRISKILATNFPGAGSIYLHQSLNFIKPVFHDSVVRFDLVITELKPDKKIVSIRTEVYSDDNLVIDGMAVIKCLDL